MGALDSEVGVELVEGEHLGEVTDAHLLVLLSVQVLAEVIGELIVQVGVQERVILVGEGVLTVDRSAYHYNVRGCHLIEQTHGLASVQDYQDVLVEVLEVHFIKDLGEVLGMDDLRVLNFKEVLSTMAIHVDK